MYTTFWQAAGESIQEDHPAGIGIINRILKLHTVDQIQT